MSTPGDTSTCLHCDEPIRLDDNGAGGTVWCHHFGSTVCDDWPNGSVEDGPTAEPRVEHVFGEYQPREWDTGFPGGHECQVCGCWFSPDDLWDRDDLHCEA